MYLPHCVFILYRHVCDNPANEFIDQLTSLFHDLQQHEACTYNITKKLGIDNGTVCQNNRWHEVHMKHSSDRK